MKLTEEEKASYLSLCSMVAGGSERDPKLTQFVSTRRGVLTLEMTQAKPATINFKFEYQTVESKHMIQMMCKVAQIKNLLMLRWGNVWRDYGSDPIPVQKPAISQPNPQQHDELWAKGT